MFEAHRLELRPGEPRNVSLLIYVLFNYVLLILINVLFCPKTVIMTEVNMSISGKPKI